MRALNRIPPTCEKILIKIWPLVGKEKFFSKYLGDQIKNGDMLRLSSPGCVNRVGCLPQSNAPAIWQISSWAAKILEEMLGEVPEETLIKCREFTRTQPEQYTNQARWYSKQKYHNQYKIKKIERKQAAEALDREMEFAARYEDLLKLYHVVGCTSFNRYTLKAMHFNFPKCLVYTWKRIGIVVSDKDAYKAAGIAHYRLSEEIVARLTDGSKVEVMA